MQKSPIALLLPDGLTHTRKAIRPICPNTARKSGAHEIRSPTEDHEDLKILSYMIT